VKVKLLLLAVVALALAGCGSSRVGSSGIAVPRMGHSTVEQGYALLRSKGFRVSTSAPLTLNPYLPSGILKTVPAAGTQLARGSVVTLVPESGPSGSPVGVLDPKHYRLPDFVGRSPADAMHWLDRHAAFWATRLPRLHASTAPNLFAAYVVTAQRPAARSRLSENGWLELTVRPRG
jgi:beta-lactam-binding protein with PASTA domain